MMIEKWSVYVHKLQHLIKGTLSLSMFPKSLVNKREVTHTSFL